MGTAAWLGIDVSKRKIDVALEWDGGRRAKVFGNDPDGWSKLLSWLRGLGAEDVHACLEATGPYGEGVALALHEAGHRVSIVNPAQVKHFARTRLGRNKTDRLDAALIRDYCRLFGPPPWTPPPPAMRALRDLVRTRQVLLVTCRTWSNRRGTGEYADAAAASMDRVIERLETELAEVERAIEAAIQGDPDLRHRHGLLVSIPGIGSATAAVVLVEMPCPGVLRQARAAAAYAGLTPSQHQSGATARPARLSKVGNAALRQALYFPAITAMRFNPAVAALRQRLQAQNRLKPMQVVTAAMRKLLHLCFGVLKTGKPFDPDHATAKDKAAVVA